MLDLLYQDTLLVTAGICLLVQLLSWFWQMRTQNSDIVDISWSCLIVVCGLLYFVTGTGDSFHLNMILLIPVLWYSRLAWHLINRYRVQHEDGRYQALRKHWATKGSTSLQIKLLFFFLFQAALGWLFSYPAYIIANLNQDFSALDIMAIAVLSLSFVGVTLADRQLASYKKSGKQGVCKEGLWKYSRHPNYFFEWLHWFCYPMLGLSYINFVSLDNVILLLSPFVMLLFLLKLTGIPFNEEQNIRSKGDEYREYQKTTNKFFLGIPK